MHFDNAKKKKRDHKQQKWRFCTKLHIFCKREIFSAESKKCCAEVNLSVKIDNGFNNVTTYDILLKGAKFIKSRSNVLYCIYFSTEKVILIIFH